MFLFLSIILGIGFGCGFATLVFGYFLNKSNNIGDSTGSGFYYVRSYKFHARRDKMSPGDCSEFISRNHRPL